jgi:hypothetical protein
LCDLQNVSVYSILEGSISEALPERFQSLSRPS